MNVMLQQLIDRGLVSRADRADSGRALPAALTRDGIAALDAAERLVDGVEQRMLSGLTPAQSAALGRGLAASVAALAVSGMPPAST
jgi:DNA-binding MarR family transcriptional regulator